MIRKAASKFLILTAATLASGAVAVNCGKKADHDDIGNVGLALVLPGGGVVNTVSYTISGSAIPMSITGSIDVSAPGTTQATALVSGLPEGMYNVTMMAQSTDMMQNCSGMAPFTVVRNQTAMANVILQCTRINTRGSVAINGRIDQCPLITSVSANRLQGVVNGAPIMVGAVVSELDPGDTVTYNWTANPTGIGTIGAQGANTTFTCTAVGSTQLSLAVSDGVCGDNVMNAIPLNCVAGSGTGGAGGAGTGTGGVGGSPAGAGGSPAGAGGSPAGAGGSPAGAGGSPAGAGGSPAGAGGSPAGTGGGGATGTGGTGGSVVACQETNPPAAVAASCATCLADQINPATDGCCAIQNTDPMGFTLCQSVSACMRAGGPPVGACNVGGDVSSCFCGTNPATCGTGGANGPCVAQFRAAAGRNVVTMTTDSPTDSQVSDRQGDPAYALGRAANIQTIAAVFCPADCGF